MRKGGGKEGGREGEMERGRGGGRKGGEELKGCYPSGFSIHGYIIESVDSISRDEPDYPLTQYITNAGISHARYTITHFKHHHRVLRLVSNRMSI